MMFFRRTKSGAQYFCWGNAPWGLKSLIFTKRGGQFSSERPDRRTKTMLCEVKPSSVSGRAPPLQAHRKQVLDSPFFAECRFLSAKTSRTELHGKWQDRPTCHVWKQGVCFFFWGGGGGDGRGGAGAAVATAWVQRRCSSAACPNASAGTTSSKARFASRPCRQTSTEGDVRS